MIKSLDYLVYVVYYFVLISTAFMLDQETTSSSSQVTEKIDNGSLHSTLSVQTKLQNSSSPEKLIDTTSVSDNVTKETEFSVTMSPATTVTADTANDTWPEYVKFCPSNVACDKLSAECINCDFNETCIYGKNTSVVCRAKDMIFCLGNQNFTRWFTCQYCYQSASYLHSCTSDTCKVISAPRPMYQANCTVNENVVCLGKRTFYKRLPCNWTSGKRWSTALILSITIGGFGADRFYLGLWREGIGKLFSFGGLGVWTLVDVVLVATGYIGPADGSLYIW